MKVLLIKPTSHTDGITPPLGLGYLATALRPAHEVKIIDGPKVYLNRRKLARILDTFKPDMVGFSVISLDLYLTASYLKLVREVVPDAITVVGGPHPSADTEDTFYNYIPDLDYAFVGEAEKGLRMLADFLEGGEPGEEELKSVPGLVWKEGVEFHKNPPFREADLDTLGFVAWDLMDPRTYPPAPHSAFARAFPVAPISATRGCPFECRFCAAGKIHGKKIRRRSLPHLIEEAELLVKKYGMKELHIVDDNFTFDRDYVLEFCEQLARRFPQLSWTCANGVRLDTLDKELLIAMRRSGCYALAVGIESGSQEILDQVKKKLTIEKVLEKVQLIHDTGIKVIGFFLFGFPGETIEDMHNTLRFSMQLPLTRAQYMFFHPFPGTYYYHSTMRDHPERLRALHSSFEKIAYIEENMTASQMRWMHRFAFLRFYLRPRQLFELVTSIRSPGHAYHIMQRILRWMVIS